MTPWDRADPFNRQYEVLIFDHSKPEIGTWRNYLKFLQAVREQYSKLVAAYEKSRESISEAFGRKKKSGLIQEYKRKNRDMREEVTSLLKKKMSQAIEAVFYHQYRNNPLPGIRNMWMRLGTRPFEAHVPFFTPSNRRRKRIRNYLRSIWKYYNENEKNDQSLFTNIQEISALTRYIDQIINAGAFSQMQRQILEDKKF